MSAIEMQPHQMAMLLYNNRFYGIPLITGYSDEHSADIKDKIAWIITPGNKIKLTDGKAIFCKFCPKKEDCPIPDDYNSVARLLLETILGKSSNEFVTDDLYHVMTDLELQQFEGVLYREI